LINVILLILFGIIIGTILSEIFNRSFYIRKKKNSHKVLVTINYTNEDQLSFELNNTEDKEITKTPDILNDLLNWYKSSDSLEDYSLILDDYITRLSKSQILDIHFEII
jgi:hypothetical protein